MCSSSLTSPRESRCETTSFRTLRRDSAGPLNIYEELIDSVRFDSLEYERQLVGLYKAKYVGDTSPALVITLTGPALDFALSRRNELFPTAALLFGAVDERALLGRNLDANVTGVFSHFDAQMTIEAALTLHPLTRHIVVVGGTSRRDREYIEVVQSELRSVARWVDITYITDNPLDDMLAAVAALHDDGLVLFVSMQSDGDRVARTAPEVLAELRRTATVPIYGMSRTFLGQGIVGGMLFDTISHGTDLAERARQILSGEKAAGLTPLRTRNTMAFDGRELKRFGIDESRLPAGATVVNRELSLWETYRRTGLVVSAVLVGQSLLIGGLLVQGRRRRRAELALRTLSGRLLSAQEEERRRIARELHDNLSQQMAMLAMEIDQAAAGSVRSPSTVACAMRQISERTAEISTEIHNISHSLHSTKLEMLGLATAVRGHCREMLAHGVHVHFTEFEVPRTLSQDVALCLFRILQEGLNNVVKHSGAHEAHVTLDGRKEALLLSIVDFGCGFDEGAAADRDGLGLASMRERLRLIGGEVTIRSRAGYGTTIDVSVALTNSRRRSAGHDSVRVA